MAIWFHHPNSQHPVLASCGRMCVALFLLALTGATMAWGRPVDRRFHAPDRFERPAAGQVAFPVYQTRLHSVGQVWFAISNYGLIGTENSNRVAHRDRDLLSISYSPSFEYPAGTRNDYLYAGGLWIGGIVGNDTLVSISINGVSSPVNEWASYDSIREASSQRGTRCGR